jgi:hypothetical protein
MTFQHSLPTPSNGRDNPISNCASNTPSNAFDFQLCFQHPFQRLPTGVLTHSPITPLCVGRGKGAWKPSPSNTQGYAKCSPTRNHSPAIR